MKSGQECAEQLVEQGLDRVAEAARFLKISVSHVYSLMEKGVLPSVRIGRSRRVPHRAVVDLAARNLVARTAE
jgi:excisionase family DNA binding protein